MSSTSSELEYASPAEQMSRSTSYRPPPASLNSDPSRAATYTYRHFCEASSIPMDDWAAAQDQCIDWDMSIELLRCVEQSMRDTLPQALIIYADDEPVAAAIMVLLNVDPLMFSSDWVKRCAAVIRNVLPSFLQVRVSTCGHALTAGGSTLRISHRANPQAALKCLDGAMRRHAADAGSQLILLKEFLAEQREFLQPLAALGYLRADSLPDNYFNMRYDSFDAFEANLRSRYRNQLRRTIKKFRESGLQIRVVTSSTEAERAYTDAVHKLYMQVRSHAEAGLECLTADFFRGLCREFPENVHFTFAYRGTEIVGFICGIIHVRKYYNLFCGFDYDLNETSSLYFNLMIEDLRYALSLAPDSIHMGATADSFKERLGAFQEPLDFYVRGVGQWSWPLRWLATRLFPPSPQLERRNILTNDSLPLRVALRESEVGGLTSEKGD